MFLLLREFLCGGPPWRSLVAETCSVGKENDEWTVTDVAQDGIKQKAKSVLCSATRCCNIILRITVSCVNTAYFTSSFFIFHWNFEKLTPWSWTLVEKILIFQRVKIFSPCTKFKCSLLHQEPTIGPYSGPDETRPHPPPNFFRINLILSCIPLGLSNYLIPSSFLAKIVYAFLISPMHASCPFYFIRLVYIQTLYRLVCGTSSTPQLYVY
jgi:hypothetical protein